MRSLNYYLCKANRISAWLLVAFFIIYGITGYGRTRGIIDPAFSAYWHSALALPLIILLSFHGLYGLRIAVCSMGLRPNRIIDIILTALGAFFVLGAVYIMHMR